MSGPGREVVLRIRRYDPEAGGRPAYREYRVPVAPGMVVLDGLWYVKEHLDPTLAWRSSCRMGVCGSCGMLIQGRPGLACNTQVREAARGDRLTLAPLPNFAIVRDLVPDLGPMLEAHGRMLPWIAGRERGEMLEPSEQFRLSPDELLEILQFSYCIKCGCCMAACPTVATDPAYSGPQPLSQGYRYLADRRDGALERRRRVLAGDAGPWRCHFAGECSRVCPKGVDPARAVQRLKRELVLASFRLGRLRRRAPAPLLPAEARPSRREGIPEPPPPTVAGAPETAR